MKDLAHMFCASLVTPGYLTVGSFRGVCGQTAPLQFYLPSDKLWVSDDTRPAWSGVYAGSSTIIALLSSQPELVAGKKIYEIGCGSGLASIAAVRLGAKSATATDIDPAACAATAANAYLNRVSLNVSRSAATDSWGDDIDVVLAGDVLNSRFIGPEQLRDMRRRIVEFRTAGGTVIVGDTCLEPPHRAEEGCLPAWARDAIRVPGAEVVVLGPLPLK